MMTSSAPRNGGPEDHPGWTFITNHGAALLEVAANPNATIRQVARSVGITERAAARILRDLRDGGYIAVTRTGRRNSYAVDLSLPLRRHRDVSVAELMRGLLEAAVDGRVHVD